ncbi:ubiquinol-cytochrome C chaperone family protein [Sphingomonas sp. 28-63-12]|uniref:ubiquinol-cytochrome C chaperone family protein n=1 Tax=Sphingomonas sp. 28-63-12 TaxID=1970434 RepID=UPI000BD50A20|nr:MAG: ubiquinol-cytochrome C chaperone [Sphingomonas sp. 28-63-12]
MNGVEMGLIDRLFGASRPAATAPLYTAILAEGRAPHWYLAGAVPDTMDGRFDMIAAILALVLLRLEDDPASAAASAELTEQFIEDMDGQLRESGIGDVGIGKYVGQMMSMLGGRLGAYRAALASGELAPALRRNLYRGTDPGDQAIAYAAGQVLALRDRLAELDSATILAGTIR